jgi:hypothetical protein
VQPQPVLVRQLAHDPRADPEDGQLTDAVSLDRRPLAGEQPGQPVGVR